MNVNTSEIELLEQQLIEYIGELCSSSSSECRLRECLRAECSRAEAAETARDAALNAATEARNSAATATTSATQAATTLTNAHEQITGLKIQLELSERQKKIYEDRYSEISTQIVTLERELQQLRPLQVSYNTLQRQYIELQERTCNATEEARREVSRLEGELRRIERCAASGSEIRERARLAAAAHARERRFVSAELQHTTRELQNANTEIARLGVLVAELQLRISNSNNTLGVNKKNPDEETVRELREALEAERAGVEKLERALGTALADNASLAAMIHCNDNNYTSSKPSSQLAASLISPIDDFLAE